MESQAESLVEMIKKDPELMAFFKLIHQHDLREKAVEALNRHLAKSSGGVADMVTVSKPKGLSS